MPALLALDPGLDCTGWSLFDLAGMQRPLFLPDAGKRYVDCGRWVTRASEADDMRMVALVRELMGDVAERRGTPDAITVVAIEAPPRPGLYGRHEKKWSAAAMAQGVAYANALPALYLGAATALGLRAFYVPASTQPKPARWAQYGPFLAMAGRTNQDERDAAIVGMQTLTDSRRTWAA